MEGLSSYRTSQMYRFQLKLQAGGGTYESSGPKQADEASRRSSRWSPGPAWGRGRTTACVWASWLSVIHMASSSSLPATTTRRCQLIMINRVTKYQITSLKQIIWLGKWKKTVMHDCTTRDVTVKADARHTYRSFEGRSIVRRRVDASQKITRLPKWGFMTSHAYRRCVTPISNRGRGCESPDAYRWTESRWTLRVLRGGEYLQ